ncbi:MAG TPA: hypothetical protein VHT53_10815 [Candidatus Elarobacter sp.]|nr:hypothetical protein [Candidatus Elarobacter sp.]
MLAARIDAAKGTSRIPGGVGPSYGTYQEPPPRQGAAYWAPPPEAEPQPQPMRVQRPAAVAVRPESRALVALSYPFWPLAIFALLDARAPVFVKRQAWQSLGFNAGMFGLSGLLGAASFLPFAVPGTWGLLAFFLPTLWFVASVVYAFRVWNGDDVNVPIVCDWVDARLGPAPAQTQTQG